MKTKIIGAILLAFMTFGAIGTTNAAPRHHHERHHHEHMPRHHERHDMY